MDNETSTQAMERKEKPLNELLTSSMVSIYVGPENTHWYIHERLLCYQSKFFSDIFYADDKNAEQKKAQKTKAFGLSDEEDLAFEMFVGWLYSRTITVPKEEKDVGPLLDLYLLSEKLQTEKLSSELVGAISDYYYNTHSYPSLRRVQHVYANTDNDNEMREMMVGSIAKLLTTSEKVPSHWASALQRNGQLALDIIRSIQQWKLEEETIPDARDRSSSRGRSAKDGFSAIDRAGTDSVETNNTNGTNATSNLGVESLPDQDHDMQESQVLKSEDSEAVETSISPPPTYSALTSPVPYISDFTTPVLEAPSFTAPQSRSVKSGSSNSSSPPRPKKPPDSPTKSALNDTTRPRSKRTKYKKRRLSVTFADEVQYSPTPSLNSDGDSDSNNTNTSTEKPLTTISEFIFYPPPLATKPIVPPQTVPIILPKQTKVLEDLGISSNRKPEILPNTPPDTPLQPSKVIVPATPFSPPDPPIILPSKNPSIAITPPEATSETKADAPKDAQGQAEEQSPAKGLGLDLTPWAQPIPLAEPKSEPQPEVERTSIAKPETKPKHVSVPSRPRTKIDKLDHDREHDQTSSTNSSSPPSSKSLTEISTDTKRPPKIQHSESTHRDAEPRGQLSLRIEQEPEPGHEPKEEQAQEGEAKNKPQPQEEQLQEPKPQQPQRQREEVTQQEAQPLQEQEQGQEQHHQPEPQSLSRTKEQALDHSESHPQVQVESQSDTPQPDSQSASQHHDSRSQSLPQAEPPLPPQAKSLAQPSSQTDSKSDQKQSKHQCQKQQKSHSQPQSQTPEQQPLHSRSPQAGQGQAEGQGRGATQPETVILGVLWMLYIGYWAAV